VSAFTVRDMRPQDEAFVSTCSHVGESQEIDDCARERRHLFNSLRAQGASFKVAAVGHDLAGFAYGIPIERSPWGPIGESLSVIPCLYVLPPFTSRGIGRALIDAIETDARAAGRSGVTVTAYRGPAGADWFMPATFFERLGYASVAVRAAEVLLWKPFTDDATPPRQLESRYVFEPVPDAVAVDLFWNAFCPTSAIEARRVREVCQEFGDRVRLREFQAEQRDILLRHGIPRGIYVNGKHIGWGYEAPKDGIRDAVQSALSSNGGEPA